MAFASSDTNQSALLLHLSSVLWNNESMSDVTLKACGRSYHLHKVLVLQSPKLKKALEASPGNHTVIEWGQVDEYVKSEGLELALGSLYGRHPAIDTGNVQDVLVAAAFLELEDLARTCVAVMSARLERDNFLEVFKFVTDWKQGGEKGAELEAFCWKFLFRTAFRELRPVLGELSLAQLERLLTADELWIPTELDRFRLIMEVLEPRLLEAREALYGAVVGEVLDGVVENVSGVSDSNGARKGVKKPGGSPEGSMKELELGSGSWRQQNHGFLGSESLDGVDPSMSNDFSDGWGSVQSDGLPPDGPEHSGILQLQDAMASASEALSVVDNVLSGEEGLLYGSVGFGPLMGVRGKLMELELERADQALKEGLWEKELLSSLIVFHAFRGSELKSIESMYNAADLRIQAMNLEMENAWVFAKGMSLPRLRFSVEFDNVASLGRKTKTDMRSEQIYFAGSLFRIVLTIHASPKSPEKTIGIFLQRCSDLANAFVDASGFIDPRSAIDAQITFIAGTGRLEVIELSGRISPPHNNKGYSRFLPFSSIKDYLSPSGTLRVTVIVSLVFDFIDVKSPIYVKAGQQS